MAKKKSGKPNAAKSEAESVDFEASMDEVERIVSQLESGELGLSESLEQYEKGVGQLKQCHALLEAAEQRVSVLSGFDADGNPVTKPMKTSKKSSGSTSRAKKGTENTLKSSQDEDDVDDGLALF
jgi:exodeoxyribonuclease VII small subunit